MNPRLRAAFENEMRLGWAHQMAGDLEAAFRNFERAHILGQRSTGAHVRAHLAMLHVGWSRRDAREIVGQMSRVLAALLLSRVWVPLGNTGGANVSALRSMEIPEDLAAVLRETASDHWSRNL